MGGASECHQGRVGGLCPKRRSAGRALPRVGFGLPPLRHGTGAGVTVSTRCRRPKGVHERTPSPWCRGAGRADPGALRAEHSGMRVAADTRAGGKRKRDRRSRLRRRRTRRLGPAARRATPPRSPALMQQEGCSPGTILHHQTGDFSPWAEVQTARTDQATLVTSPLRAGSTVYTRECG